MRTACAADLQKFCPKVERGRDAIRECLQAHAAELSDGCKAATASAGQKGGKAREADARKLEGSLPQ
jgi:Cysteine rich repeat